MLLEDQNQIKNQLDDLASNIVAYQKRLDDREGKTDQAIELLKTEVADGIQKVNDLEAKVKADEEARKLAEKKAARINFGESLKNDSELRKNIIQYLKYGVMLKPDTIEKTIEAHVRDHADGASEDWVKSQIAELKTKQGMIADTEMKSIMVGNDPQGGFFVHPEMSQEILSRIFETTPMRSVANIVTIASDSIQYPIDDEEFDTGGNVSEVESRIDTDNSELGMLEIHTHEQYAQPKATQKMLQDAKFDVESWITQKVARKFARKENEHFVIGDGAGKPKGILAYPAWTSAGVYERGKVEQVNSGILGNFDSDSLIHLQNSLLEDYQPNAVWIMKRATFSSVMTLKQDGKYLLNPLGFWQGFDKLLLGKKVVFGNDMPEIANDALSIVYGDFQEGYTIVDRLGLTLLRDPYTMKPFVRFYTTKRYGGAVTNYQSIKILKLSA